MKQPSPLPKFLRQMAAGYVIIGVLIVSLLVFRWALPGMAKKYINRKLNELPGYEGHVDDVTIHLFRGAYVIRGLLLKKTTDPAKYPFIRIRQADFSIEWRTLFKGRLVGEVILNHPQLNVLATEKIAKEPSKERWTRTVKALMPITINRLRVNNGKVAYLDLHKQPPTNLHINQLQLTALNLANVEKTSKRLPSHVSLTGISLGGGQLKADMDINALKELPDLEVGMSLKSTNLLSLNNFFEGNAKIDVERGNIDIFANLTLMDGRMKGYVKPFISNLKILDVKKDIKKKGGILRVAKEAMVGLFAKVVTNPKTKKIATVIRIKGDVNDPESSSWETFVGVLQNAFVRAFHESLGNELKAKGS